MLVPSTARRLGRALKQTMRESVSQSEGPFLYRPSHCSRSAGRRVGQGFAQSTSSTSSRLPREERTARCSPGQPVTGSTDNGVGDTGVRRRPVPSSWLCSRVWAPSGQDRGRGACAPEPGDLRPTPCYVREIAFRTRSQNSWTARHGMIRQRDASLQRDPSPDQRVVIRAGIKPRARVLALGNTKP